MDSSSASTSGSSNLSLTHIEATSANTIEGVRQRSACSIASRAWGARSLPRIISAQAKVSIVRFKPIGLREAVELTLAASDQAVQGSRPSLTNQLSDGLIGGANVERDSNLLKVAQGRSRDSYGSVRPAHHQLHASMQDKGLRSDGLGTLIDAKPAVNRS